MERLLVAKVAQLWREALKATLQIGKPSTIQSIISKARREPRHAAWRGDGLSGRSPAQRSFGDGITGNIGVHVSEGALAVLLPGPYVKLVESRKAVAVGGVVEIEQVTIEFGRPFHGDVFNADERQLAVGSRLVHHGFGLC